MPTDCRTLFRTAFLLIAIVGVVKSAYGQSNDAAIVDQFFPESLISESDTDFNNGGLPPVRHTSFVAADLNGTGQADFLVAAYTNGSSAVVRVLRRQGTSATLVAEPALPLMGGIIPEVSLVDLDGDSRPEIVVHYSAATGGYSAWIFKWTGTALTVFGPTEMDDGDVTTVLHDVGFRDVTGDGIPEILNPPEHKASDLTTTVYQLVGGAYTQISTKIYESRSFIRRTATPQTETITFDLVDPTMSYVMLIRNGDDAGADRASSVQITLNGNEVAGTSQFNQQVQVYRLPITVSDSNTLSVRFAGQPQSQIWLAIVTE